MRATHMTVIRMTCMAALLAASLGLGRPGLAQFDAPAETTLITDAPMQSPFLFHPPRKTKQPTQQTKRLTQNTKYAIRNTKQATRKTPQTLRLKSLRQSLTPTPLSSP